ACVRVAGQEGLVMILPGRVAGFSRGFMLRILGDPEWKKARRSALFLWRETTSEFTRPAPPFLRLRDGRWRCGHRMSELRVRRPTCFGLFFSRSRIARDHKAEHLLWFSRS